MTYRIGITFDDEQYQRFMALSEFEEKKPATLAAEIVKAYVSKRSADVDSILTARQEYQQRIDTLRRSKNS